MESPKFIVHGTSSEKDAEKIKNDGFEVQEGRATVSGNLIYSFEWATQQERRKGSKSKSEIEDKEEGRIIVMEVPEDKTIDYATHTGVEFNEELKEIRGYSSKYTSGRKQLAIYSDPNSFQRKKELEEVKSGQGQVPDISIEKDNILASILPTQELGDKLEEIKIKIHNLEEIDLEQYSTELSEIIKSDERNFISSKDDLYKIISNLLETTMEAEVINEIRALSGEVYRALGYKVYNRAELKEKSVEIEELQEKLNRIAEKIDSPEFNLGREHLNRYIKTNIHSFIKKLIMIH